MYTGVIEVDKEIAYQKLSESQRDFLDNHIKRGRRTMWLNILAKHKGAHLTAEQLESDYDQLLSRYLDWELIERIDHGERTKKAKCECGTSLRYQYIVLNHKTAEISKFGQTCLHNHLLLPQKVVREVVAGIKMIDLERDEILGKAIRCWKLKFDISDIEIPKQIQAQLEVGLPLLDRQEARLHNLVLEKKKKEEKRIRDEIVASNAKRFGGDPFTNTHRPARQWGNQIVQEETFPSTEYLHQETMYEIIRLMIVGQASASAVRRLVAGLLYVKIHRNEFDNNVLSEAKDAAKAALGATNNTSVRKWLVEIEYL